MEPHTHPEYEQTFARIATILDVIAQEQLTQERAITSLAESQGEIIERQARIIENQVKLSENQVKISESDHQERGERRQAQRTHKSDGPPPRRRPRKPLLTPRSRYIRHNSKQHEPGTRGTQGATPTALPRAIPRAIVNLERAIGGANRRHRWKLAYPDPAE